MKDGDENGGRSRESLLEATVNEVTTEHPETLEVFHRHGLDCCCGGHRPVAEAAERHAVDTHDLLRDLEKALSR